MILYPVLLNLKGADCLIVGGGEVARRKIDHLIGAGARVAVVAPEAVAPLRRLARRGTIQWSRAEYRPELLAEATKLVFACTDRPEVNRRVVADAGALGIPANSATDPEGGDFHVPSMVRRGSLLLTVSTGGRSPALAREICHRLEQQFGPAWGDFTEFLGGLRKRWKANGEAALIHERMLELIASDTFEVLQSEGKAAAGRRARALIEGRKEGGPSPSRTKAPSKGRGV